MSTIREEAGPAVRACDLNEDAALTRRPLDASVRGAK